MMNYDYLQNPRHLIWLIPLTVWDLFWRGKGLWRAAKNSQLYWFIAMLVVNSLGILPIIYLLFFQKKKESANLKKTDIV
jgi:hypothetical protein